MIKIFIFGIVVGVLTFLILPSEYNGLCSVIAFSCFFVIGLFYDTFLDEAQIKERAEIKKAGGIFSYYWEKIKNENKK